MTETVYVARSADCYHTDQDCHALAQATRNVMTWDKDTAENWGKEECQYCSGEFEQQGGGGLGIL